LTACVAWGRGVQVDSVVSGSIVLGGNGQGEGDVGGNDIRDGDGVDRSGSKE
jgi:hypothetical protein